MSWFVIPIMIKAIDTFVEIKWLVRWKGRKYAMEYIVLQFNERICKIAGLK